MKNVGREEAEAVSQREQWREEGSRGVRRASEHKGEVSCGRSTPLPGMGQMEKKSRRYAAWFPGRTLREFPAASVLLNFINEKDGFSISDKERQWNRTLKRVKKRGTVRRSCQWQWGREVSRDICKGFQAALGTQYCNGPDRNGGPILQQQSARQEEAGQKCP